MATESSQRDRHFTVLVSDDLADAGGCALDQGARLSVRIPGAELHVLHVVAGPGDDTRMRAAAVGLRARAERECGAVESLTGYAVGIHVRAGDPAQEIVDLATDLDADLIVVGSDKPALRKKPLAGSVAAAVMQTTSRPVLVASPSEPAIEPPCLDCVRTREATGGEQWWCERRHTQHHPAAHVLSYRRDIPLAGQDPLSGGL